jgi:hypothetical protein
MEGSRTNHNKSTFPCFLWKEQNAFFGKVSQRIGAKGLGVRNKWNLKVSIICGQILCMVFGPMPNSKNKFLKET